MVTTAESVEIAGPVSTSSIGELNERSLHRALKERYAARGGSIETAVDGYIADVAVGNRIIEIQTGGFWSLKRKLTRVLEHREVTLVHPVAKDRYIVKLSPSHAGESVRDGDLDTAARPRRKSPKHGSPFDVFSALVSIPSLLEHPNLTLDVVVVIEEEVRVFAKGKRWRRHGWSTADRRLIEVVETHTFNRMADLFAMIEPELPDMFTTLHLAEAMQSSRRLGQQAAFCFRETGISEICGKQGQALLYRRTAAPVAGPATPDPIPPLP